MPHSNLGLANSAAKKLNDWSIGFVQATVGILGNKGKASAWISSYFKIQKGARHDELFVNASRQPCTLTTTTIFTNKRWENCFYQACHLVDEAGARGSNKSSPSTQWRTDLDRFGSISPAFTQGGGFANHWYKYSGTNFSRHG